MNSRFIVLIPAFQPELPLLNLVKDFVKRQFEKIIIIDDGNSQCSNADEYNSILTQTEELGAVILHHEKNEGKGQALKTGFKYIVENFPDCKGAITVDCDGQHLIKDVLNVSKALFENPEKLIIGVRNLMSKKVPLGTRTGDTLAAAFFKFSTGKRCSDTQSGLRGIPSSLFQLACEDEGSRYEYETNFLSDASAKTEILEVPVEGIFRTNGNYTHFRPIKDTLRLYGRFLKFSTSSFIAFIVDFIVFLGLNNFFRFRGIDNVGVIFASTAFARFISSIVSFMINRVWSFKGRAKSKKSFQQFGRFFILWCIIVVVNSVLVYLLEKICIPVAIAKLIANTVTFFINYLGQHNWVFVEKD